MTIAGIGGSTPLKSRGIVMLTLQSRHSDAMVTITAQILPKLTIHLPSNQVSSQPWETSSPQLKLADPEFFIPQPVDIIIGADWYGQIIKPNIIKHSSDSPIAHLSIFGWLIIGPTAAAKSQAHRSSFTITQENQQDDHLDELLTRFWVQEEVPSESLSHLTPEEEQCEEHFRTTHSRDATGRYVVRLPLKSDKINLGDSYRAAFRRLQHTQKRFTGNPEYESLYKDFMKTYEEMGHMSIVPSTPRPIDSANGNRSAELTSEMTLAHDTSVSGGLRVSIGQSALKSHTRTIYYLPHHGVLRPESTSTKLRVVFDGSCATSSGQSINDHLHIGAKIQPDITDVLLWVRQHRHIFATDITKMFRQINVHPEDWDYQRILWTDDNQQIVPYHLKTVTYGTRSAPFLAVRVLQQLIEDEGKNYPIAVPALKFGRYVDDIFGGSDSISELLQIAEQLKHLCMAGGFPLAKWHSNSEEIIKAISPAESNDATIQLGDCSSKILGLCWHASSDNFTFRSRDTQDQSKTTTKRTILSEVAQTFDPLGFLSPILIKSKMLLQELWLHKLSWDQPVPAKVLKKWLKLREELHHLDVIKVPRWIHTSMAMTCELHGFCDASQLAMAAAIYVKVNLPSGQSVTSLLCSRTKVSPLNRLTIPKLELSSALILSKLIKYVQATLKLDAQSVTLWTDSTTTLWWITTHPSTWKDFVRNRVASIQQLTPRCSWRYVPGTSNPADCASRGISLAQLKDHALWWRGPPWLSQSTGNWPKQPSRLDEPPSEEARPGQILVATKLQSATQWDLITRYSELRTLLRVTATLFRAIDRFNRIPGSSLATPLTPQDTQRATIYWAKSTQAAYFNHELQQITNNQTLPAHHAFHRLTAYLDNQGVLRVGGRLAHSQLSYSAQHPIILPRQSPLTTLIISNAHLRTFHGGTQQTLAEIRQSYWIIGGRASIKAHILRCMRCARQRGTRAQQLMGQLPQARARPSRAFQHTGVDYAGPLTLKSWKGRGAKQFKAWICVFVCMSTSAIHIEVVCDYSSEAFIAAYRRFTGRRGICHSLYSDCGTTFLGADATIQQMFTRGSDENKDIASILLNDNTHWHFNPPAAPHMGGKWEAAVKSIKHHLNRTLRDTLYTLEEITTLLTQIEAILNSRPMEPLSDDPDDLSALTPGHFLIGQPLTTLPEPNLQSINISRLSRWQLIQQQSQQFWRHWSQAYLQRQLATTKWWHQNNQIQVGSLVLLTDERLPPCKWPLARVTQLHPGDDGLTRVVTIKTATTTLIRPIVKLAILPQIGSDNQDQNQHQVADWRAECSGFLA